MPGQGGGPPEPPAGPPFIGKVKVTSTGICYDSVFLNPLPFKGKFQLIDPSTDPPSTEYGPGDTEYVGGRWWVDANGNGEMDEDDVYFACPLTTVTDCS